MSANKPNRKLHEEIPRLRSLAEMKARCDRLLLLSDAIFHGLTPDQAVVAVDSFLESQRADNAEAKLRETP